MIFANGGAPFAMPRRFTCPSSFRFSMPNIEMPGFRIGAIRARCSASLANRSARKSNSPSSSA